MTKTRHIAVIGAGAWGTALAQVFAKEGRAVTLYARDKGLAENISASRKNDVYLPDISLNPDIRVTNDLTAAIEKADIALMATPVQFVRDVLIKLEPHLSKKTPLINCSKGIEISSSMLLSEVTAEILPENPYAVLSGPTFAGEVARGLPTAVTLAATATEKIVQDWAQTLSGKTFRPYITHDVIGAEIAGALKNVIAIACGIVEGKGLGQNAKAAVMTRGMAEIKRLGLKKGAEAETFLGLSGIGDLTLTCHSMASRNYSLGFEIGRGHAPEKILATRRTVTEGVSTAKAAVRFAEERGVDMPICRAVNLILHHAASVDDIVRELLSRHLKHEEA
jgi:glycerol-3-phosphate dehydrogenase (NAD(P)+)